MWPQKGQRSDLKDIPDFISVTQWEPVMDEVSQGALTCSPKLGHVKIVTEFAPEFLTG
jgi:hypothetical protein